MRLRHQRLRFAFLLFALAACGDDAAPAEDELPGLGEDTDEATADDDTDEAADDDRDAGSRPPRRDAAAPADAGSGEDDGMESMPDGGRRRRDGGTRDDAGATDAGAPAATDAQVPAGDHCAATASWDAKWAGFEEEVLRLTNEARAKGATCGSEGSFPAAGPLAMEPRLRCSARLYSEEMVRTNNFGHTSVDGTKFDARIAKTGYRGALLGENIAAGYATPALVVAGWMKSDGHCANIMQAKYTQIGVGYYIKSGSNPHWTQNFGTPR